MERMHGCFVFPSDVNFLEMGRETCCGLARPSLANPATYLTDVLVRSVWNILAFAWLSGRSFGRMARVDCPAPPSLMEGLNAE